MKSANIRIEGMNNNLWKFTRKCLVSYYSDTGITSTYNMIEAFNKIKRPLLIKDINEFYGDISSYTSEYEKEKAKYKMDLEKKALELYPGDYRIIFIIRMIGEGVEFLDNFFLDYWKELNIIQNYRNIKYNKEACLNNDFSFSIGRTYDKKTMDQGFTSGTINIGLDDPNFINGLAEPRLYINHLKYSDKAGLRRNPFAHLIREKYGRKSANIPVIPYDPGEMTFEQSNAIEEAMNKWDGVRELSIWRIEHPQSKEKEYIMFETYEQFYNMHLPDPEPE